MMDIDAQCHAHGTQALLPMPYAILFEGTEIIEIGRLYTFVPRAYPFDYPARKQDAGAGKPLGRPCAEPLPTTGSEPFEIGIHQPFHQPQHSIPCPEQLKQRILYIFPPGIDTALDSPRLHIVVRTGRDGIGPADVHRTQQMLIPSCRHQHVVVQKHEIVVTGGGNALILTIRVRVVAGVFNHRIGMLPEKFARPVGRIVVDNNQLVNIAGISFQRFIKKPIHADLIVNGRNNANHSQ